MYKPGNTITSFRRDVEFDKGRHHRARLGFILMSTDLAAEADFYDMAIEGSIDVSEGITRRMQEDSARPFPKPALQS